MANIPGHGARDGVMRGRVGGGLALGLRVEAGSVEAGLRFAELASEEHRTDMALNTVAASWMPASVACGASCGRSSGGVLRPGGIG